jgi:formylglycine-generating enzyme required for sulfatase activity
MSGDEVEFVTVPPGMLQMGSRAEDVEACVRFWGTRLVDPTYTRAEFRRWIMKEVPRHQVKMAGFQMSRFPITNRQFLLFAESTGARWPESLQIGEPDDHPVWGVCFSDAGQFAIWLSKRLGMRCRLPTEAEWEYAARGSTTREHPFGDEFDPQRCNTAESGIGSTTPVDRYESSASVFGICDLAGNVEEWTSSFYAPYPGGTFIADDLSRRLGAQYRVLRGGSFALGGDLARCARRHGPYPAPCFRFRGFRVICQGTWSDATDQSPQPRPEGL